MDRRLFVSVNPFHARHVRELAKTKWRRPTGQQQGTKSGHRPGNKLDIPGHALHEKGLQRQKSVGPLASSQERKALLVLVINRGVCSSIGLHRVSFVRASEELFRTVVFDALEGTRDGFVLREQIRRRPILPGPPRPAAPPCAARPDPPVVCVGFVFDRSIACQLVLVCTDWV